MRPGDNPEHECERRPSTTRRRSLQRDDRARQHGGSRRGARPLGRGAGDRAAACRSREHRVQRADGARGLRSRYRGELVAPAVRRGEGGGRRREPGRIGGATVGDRPRHGGRDRDGRRRHARVRGGPGRRVPHLPQRGRGDAGGRAMSLAAPDAPGPLRRERLRTARLYFVCDARPHGEDPELLLRAALTGGVDLVQLREKELDRRAIERAGATFRRLCDTYSALFVVNDDPELAHACDADGVHLGQDDRSVADARAALGPDAVIGLSTHSEEQIAAAQGADYISVGPVWETPTKEGRPAVGLELVRHAAEHAPLPFYAIGGINPSNAEQVVEAGARRLAVVRAIRDADDPAAAATALRRAFTALGREVAPGG